MPEAGILNMQLIGVTPKRTNAELLKL